MEEVGVVIIEAENNYGGVFTIRNINQKPRNYGVCVSCAVCIITNYYHFYHHIVYFPWAFSVMWCTKCNAKQPT